MFEILQKLKVHWLLVAVGAACETSPVAVPASLSAARNVGDANHFEMLMAEEEYTVESEVPHCIALLTEIKAYRLGLTHSADWKNIMNTKDWTRFHGLYTGYRSGACPALTTRPNMISQPCLEGRNVLFKAWGDIEKLSAWKSARKSSQMQNLAARWDDAKVMGCIAYPET